MAVSRQRHVLPLPLMPRGPSAMLAVALALGLGLTGPTTAGRSTGSAGAGRRRSGSAPQFCSSGRSTTSLRSMS
eukprot:312730-Pyramimonas_sp.AAC.1